MPDMFTEARKIKYGLILLCKPWLIWVEIEKSLAQSKFYLA